jgi:hypothetical protein
MLVLLVAVATWRLARLVTVDEITRQLRERVAARGDRWAYFVTCPWCVSIWVGPLVAWAAIYHPTNRPLVVGLVALTASVVAGLGQVVEDRLDR